jgi:hypothetical protein
METLPTPQVEITGWIDLDYTKVQFPKKELTYEEFYAKATEVSQSCMSMMAQSMSNSAGYVMLVYKEHFNIDLRACYEEMAATYGKLWNYTGD